MFLVELSVLIFRVVFLSQKEVSDDSFFKEWELCFFLVILFKGSRIFEKGLDKGVRIDYLEVFLYRVQRYLFFDGGDDFK